MNHPEKAFSEGVSSVVEQHHDIDYFFRILEDHNDLGSTVDVSKAASSRLAKSDTSKGRTGTAALKSLIHRVPRASPSKQTDDTHRDAPPSSPARCLLSLPSLKDKHQSTRALHSRCADLALRSYVWDEFDADGYSDEEQESSYHPRRLMCFGGERPSLEYGTIQTYQHYVYDKNWFINRENSQVNEESDHGVMHVVFYDIETVEKFSSPTASAF